MNGFNRKQISEMRNWLASQQADFQGISDSKASALIAQLHEGQVVADFLRNWPNGVKLLDAA